MQGGARIVKALVCGIAQAGLHEGPVAVVADVFWLQLQLLRIQLE